MDVAKKSAEVNSEKSQQKQREAYAKRTQKKYRNVVYSANDEVLLLNMRKRGRKGGRMEPDFSGPYRINSVCGKLATLKNSQGIILKSKVNIGHLKPYRREQVVPKTTKTQEDLETPSLPKDTESMTTRPSVIHFAPPNRKDALDDSKEVKLVITRSEKEPVLQLESDAKIDAQEEGHNQKVLLSTKG